VKNVLDNFIRKTERPENHFCL